MDRINGTNFDPNAFGSGKHGYKTAAPFTALTPAAMNAIQEEIARVIEGFGVTLNPASFTQLFDALVLQGRQAVVQPVTDVAVWGTSSKPNEHPSSGSNLWKQIIAAKTNNNAFVRLLSGDGGAPGCWAISFNAAWNPASGAQNWSSDQTGIDSTLLVALPDGFQLLRRAAGAGTWTSWPAQAALGVSGAATVDSLIVDTSATADEFLFTTPAVHVSYMSLFSGMGDGALGFGGGTFHLDFAAGGLTQIWPIDLPDGAQLVNVKLVLNKASTGSASLSVWRKQGFDFSTTPAAMPNDFQLGTTDTDTGSGNQQLQVIGLSQVANNDSVAMYAVFVSADAGDAVYGLSVNWIDAPGPANY